MKNSKKLKIMLIILICIVVMLIGLLGIYTKQGNVYKNLLPNYTLASDIKGATVIEFELDDSIETVYYDKEGKEVDSSTITEENEKNYDKKEIVVNAEENLTKENYNKTIEIMKKRLQFLGADQYRLDLDENTGKILLTVEDDYMVDIESILPMEGKLQIVDANTKDVIIDYTDFKSVDASYVSLESGYSAYINIKLNSTGMEKFNNLTDNITKSENRITEETINEDNEENLESTESSDELNFKVIFDTDEIAEISYEDMLITGNTLRITTAENLTTETSINSKLNINTVVARLASMGKMPVIYNITAEQYIQSTAEYYIDYIVIGIIVIIIIISIVMLIKYKLNGLLAIIGLITNSSLFLILIRLTNIPISLNGFAGILVLILLYTILNNNILKTIKENTFSSMREIIKSSYSKSINVIVITLLIFIVFSFSSMTVINSMGLLMFWGWLITIIGNLLFTIPMLSIVNKK